MKTHHGQHCWGVGSSHHIKSINVDCSCINFICLFPLPSHMSLISHKVKKRTKAIPNLVNNWKIFLSQASPHTYFYINCQRHVGTSWNSSWDQSALWPFHQLNWHKRFSRHMIQFLHHPNSIVSHFLSYDGQSVERAPYGDHWRQIWKLSMVELLNTKSLKATKNARDEEFSFLVHRVFKNCKLSCLTFILTRWLLVHLVLDYF